MMSSMLPDFLSAAAPPDLCSVQIENTNAVAMPPVHLDSPPVRCAAGDLANTVIRCTRRAVAPHLGISGNRRPWLNRPLNLGKVVIPRRCPTITDSVPTIASLGDVRAVVASDVRHVDAIE